MALYNGVSYFGTISADVDYEPSEKMLDALKKKFKGFLHIVIEYGENRKQHCHFVGTSTVRHDNLKNSLRKILVDDGIDVSNYTLDLRTEPNMTWRIGYLEKEPDRKIVYSTLSDDLSEYKKVYDAKPKRDRGLKQDKCMSRNQLVEYMDEAGIHDREGVIECLKILKREGKINFAFYEKLNIKKLILWMNERFDE